MKQDKILLGHGSGGKLMHELIEDVFFPAFSTQQTAFPSDSAVLTLENKRLSFSTDSFVVDPVFFPGGNIGKLAVCGTVNDIAVSGAIPMWLSAAFIIEEGFPLNDLKEIVKSMADEARKAGIKIVTGDTKVVNKGQCDKIFINTAGIGLLDIKNENIGNGSLIKSGDKILINGTIADHGMAIMKSREMKHFESNIVSDCACLNHLIAKLSKECEIHFMRDATRGGLATVTVEICQNKDYGVELIESQISVNEEVRGFCELLGFDPMYVANEGKFVLIVAEKDSEKALQIMKSDDLGKQAAIIGTINDNYKGLALLQTSIGGKRIIDMPAGEQLPRIC